MRKYVLLLLGLSFLASCVIYVPVDYGEGPVPDEDYYYEDEYPTRLDVAYFYDYLSPYGFWAYQRPYGYVWIPSVDTYGWHPYTHGQWIWSDYGWTWISDFKWGWAPFHYGRWDWNNDFGWFWVPDTDWGPAWVTWRRSSIYLGWAPLPPEVRFVHGVGIRSLPYRLKPHFWIFVESRYFFNTRLYRYVMPRERNLTIINYTVSKTDLIMRDQRVINQGFDVESVSRLTKQRITKHGLQDVDKPMKSRVRAGELEIFKPIIQKNDEARPKESWNKDEVREKISRDEMRGSGGESRLEEVQRREKILLEETQNKEIVELEKRKEEETDKVKTSSDKVKIEKVYAERLEKLEESHEAEKSKIKKRHDEEGKKVKKRKIKN